MHTIPGRHGCCRAVLLGVSAASLVAQSSGVTTADLKGEVRSAGKGPLLPGAQLMLLNPATQESRVLHADARGQFRFWIVPPGEYVLLVEAEGHAPRKLRNLSLRMASATVLEIELDREAGAVVEVEAEAARIDPTRTQISQIIEPRLIDELPINRRSFVDFSLTTPGVVVSNTPVTGGVPTSGLSFRGMNPRQNRFLVDGLDNGDLGSGALGAPISQEAVQEFQVLTGGFSAEYGRAAGGIVNSITKSGSNTLSGSLFTYLRPGQWDASSQGRSTRAYRQAQMGFSVGGPILPDRLFYFASVERYRTTDLNDVAIAPKVQDAIRDAGFSVQTGMQPYQETQTSALVKLDYLQNSQSRWGLRFIQARSTKENQVPWGGLTARSAGGTLNARDLSFALTHQWLGGSRWVNECRVMYAQRENAIQSMDPAGTVSVTILGTASFGTQRLTPQDTTAIRTQFVDTLTISLGSHTLKAGLDLLRSRNSGAVQMNSSGLYQFQAIPQLGFATPLAAFTGLNPAQGTGFPVAFVQSWGAGSTQFRAASDALFLQDEWQLHPRFLLKVGLRYDRESLPAFDSVPAYEALANPTGTADPVYGPVRLPDGETAYASQFEIQRNWSRSRVSPRLSLSWQVTDQLRAYGGYGVFTGSTMLGPVFAARIANDRETQTWIRTILDPVAAWPWIPWSGADTVAQNHRYTAPPAGYTPTLSIPGSYGMPEVKAWNLGLEWTPSPGHRLFLDVQRSRGEGFMNMRDVNAYVPYYSQALSTIVLRRPDLRFGSVFRIDGSGQTRGRLESLGWQWRYREDLLLNLSYTHNRAEDNYIDSTPDFPAQNTFDPQGEWGPSSENQTHQVLLSAACTSRSSAHPWLDRWDLALIGRYASGRTYSPLVGYDQNLNGDGNSDRRAGVGRNSETTPSIRNVDLRVARPLAWGKVKLELSLDVFNLFNTTHILKVQNVLSAATPPYGSPLIYGPMRQFQFGAKLQF
jgi:hypothetical protein